MVCTLLPLAVVLGFLVQCSSSIAMAQDEYAPFKAIVKTLLVGWNGKMAITKGPSPTQFWFSDDGMVCQSEKFKVQSLTKGDTAKILVGTYFNGSYFVISNRDESQVADSSRGNMVAAVVGARDFTFPGVPEACLFGREFFGGASFIEIFDAVDATKTIDTDASFDGVARSHVTIRWPSHGVHEFWFGGNPTRLTFYRETLSPDDLMASYVGESTLSKNYPGFQLAQMTYGPFEYENDLPIATTASGFQRCEGSGSSYEIAEARLSLDNVANSDRPLNLDTIEFTMPIREGGVVMVREPGGVPYQIHGRRLVRVVDGLAEEIARRSSFRKPTAWQRWRNVVLGLAIVGLISTYIWLRRK